MELIIQLISAVYNFLWGDLFTIPLPGGKKALTKFYQYAILGIQESTRFENLISVAK